MGHLQLDEIITATGGKILSGEEKVFQGLSIDSRTIREGELFVALKGDRFDGHDFLSDALQQGSGAIISSPSAAPVSDRTIIQVRDTLSALQTIAAHLRRKSGVPVIGVTGTNGKTTTKELIASILGERRKVLKTRGNLNNHIGLPLCISRMDGDETFMVLEMGSNAEGDIRLLCEIAHPDVAVVTNVGPAHLEGFGSLEMVRKTDLEILGYASTAIVNADDCFLLEGIRDYRGKLITYGIEHPADVSAKEIVLGDKGSRFVIQLPGGTEICVNLKIAGKFNVSNALAAAAAAAELGTGPDEIRKGLEAFSGVPMRLEIKELFGCLVISDVYNANPASMEEALKELVRLKKQRTIAVLGDMLELGSYSEEAHRKLLRLAAGMNIDILIAVGPEMIRASHEFPGTCHRVKDAVQARSVLLDICRAGDTILVKGSRGMTMEKVLAEAGSLMRQEAENAL